MRPLRSTPLWCLLLSGCGAPLYFPAEPPPVGSFEPDSGDTALDTGLPPQTPEMPCSGQGTYPITLRIENHGSAPIQVYWVDFDCFEVHYAEVAPSSWLEQGTWDSHVWVARDGQGRYLDHVEVGLLTPQTWEVQ